MGIQRQMKMSTGEKRLAESSIVDRVDGISVLLSKISEKEFRQQVLDLARLFKWRCYFTWNSIHSPAGFPDLVMARRHDIGTVCIEYETRLIVAELKRQGGIVTPGQQEWLDFFKGIDAETYIWRPSDWDQVQKVLR